MAFVFYEELRRDDEKNSARKVAELGVFNERLLAPAGPAGFRVTTKIHAFWSVYFNGLGIAIADALEDERDPRVRSYRFKRDGGEELFDRSFSWRAFREATVAEALGIADGAIVVQTDISSFYEHVSHHHIQNALNDLFPDGRMGNQINALVGKFSAGRSFGLPVGGQASRVLAELFLNAVDQKMTVGEFRWFRYVDDYVLIADSNADAYRALSSGACQGTCRLSHAAKGCLSVACEAFVTTDSRSGLSVTAPMGVQSRVQPDQRAGLRSRAWTYTS
jgi:hypothetical protein